MKPGCKNAPVLTRARRGRAAPAREGRRGSDRQRALTFRVSPLAQQHRTTEAVGRNGTRPQAGRKARQRRARFWHRRTGSAGGNKKQRAERRRGRRHGAATAYAPEVDSDAVLEQSDRVLPVSARGRPWEKPEAKAANRPRIEGPAPRARSSGSDADEVRTAATVSSAAYSNIEVEYIARIGKGLPSGGLRSGKRGLMNFFLLQEKNQDDDWSCCLGQLCACSALGCRTERIRTGGISAPQKVTFPTRTLKLLATGQSMATMARSRPMVWPSRGGT